MKELLIGMILVAVLVSLTVGDLQFLNSYENTMGQGVADAARQRIYGN